MRLFCPAGVVQRSDPAADLIKQFHGVIMRAAFCLYKQKPNRFSNSLIVVWRDGLSQFACQPQGGVNVNPCFLFSPVLSEARTKNIM